MQQAIRETPQKFAPSKKAKNARNSEIKAAKEERRRQGFGSFGDLLAAAKKK